MGMISFCKIFLLYDGNVSSIHKINKIQADGCMLNVIVF